MHKFTGVNATFFFATQKFQPHELLISDRNSRVVRPEMQYVSNPARMAARQSDYLTIQQCSL